MKKNTLYFTTIIIAVIGLASCGLFGIPPKWVDSVKPLKQPAKSEYSLSKQQFKYSDLIDTSAIYVHEGEYVGQYEESPSRNYKYYRFSNTGIAFSSGFKDIYPDSTFYNSYPYTFGQHLFYEVNDDIVRIEFYNHHLRMFEFSYGKILDSGDILIYKNKGRPFSTGTQRLNMFYKKFPADFSKSLKFPE